MLLRLQHFSQQQPRLAAGGCGPGVCLVASHFMDVFEVMCCCCVDNRAVQGDVCFCIYSVSVDHVAAAVLS
jgi:hypothetical protein